MSLDASTPKRRHHLVATLSNRDYRLFISSRFCSTTATNLFDAAVAWQVYEISGSALQLGVLGLVRFLPSLGLSLFGGVLADRYDRRKIILSTKPLLLLLSAWLFFVTFSGTAQLALIYGLVLAFKLIAALEQPAGQSLLPLLVPRENFATAVTLNSALVQLSAAVGPAVAGFVIAASGIAAAYVVYMALLVASLLLLLLVRLRHKPSERSALSLAAIGEGIKFVRNNQVLLGAMSLDMFSVIFAGAQALLPIYAKEILHVGPSGYGLLNSSQAVGAFFTSLTLAVLPPIRNTGRALLIGVACFGLTTIFFGFSTSFPLALFFYTLSGIADQINVVTRRTTIQIVSPDHLRGRISSISSIFVGASNHIGMLESGLVAAVAGPVFSVVSGGVGCLVVVAVIAARMPELRRYRMV